ncbi:MAG: hypothetical protein Ct9H90mP16_00790 [Candidatus Poseidoniales archaeon]|nr:MAG: hypothetical protein Ct9H90mP16_00790 [Candidatus Poseidoniales archaeon]
MRYRHPTRSRPWSSYYGEVRAALGWSDIQLQRITSDAEVAERLSEAYGQQDPVNRPLHGDVG